MSEVTIEWIGLGSFIVDGAIYRREAGDQEVVDEDEYKDLIQSGPVKIVEDVPAIGSEDTCYSYQS